MHRLGVVSFLNSRPLIAGLEQSPQVELLFDVPSRLARLLDERRVDAALVPVVDVLRARGRYRVISNACIGCHGETMTVRVFSQLAPPEIETLWVDRDSHTSAALVQVLWRETYGRDLKLEPLDAARENTDQPPAILLIGDKVIAPRRDAFAYEVDLGQAWFERFRLPFVFAVWACCAEENEQKRRAEPCTTKPRGEYELERLLNTARDRGVARAAEIAAAYGPPLGWPVELATRYLTSCLRFTLDPPSIEGANLFGQLCAKAGLVPQDARIPWPEEARSQEAT